ncbi:PEPxxWA-CTERM sorting domain-containing protein [Sandarakinorhabdus cyanobacteriorum]|nr:PEPxxWA-CTERM sorting domain-containing protein [Sandarakinorhabdus cyanobacteriorum]
MRTIILLAAAATALAAAAPAAAVTTFANFSARAGGNNVRWVRTAGTGNASFYSIATNTGSTPASRLVNFSFLQPSIAPYVTNVTARWTLNGTVSSTVATVNGATLEQNNLTGSFSFLTTAPITIGGNSFAVGSNLLSGTFNRTVLSGNRAGNSAGISGSTPSSTISFTSDFLDFSNTLNRNFALNLTSIVPVLQANPITGTPTGAINNFRAVAGGSFSSDPAPIVTAVPEPGSWAMMLAGMGLVGFARRRRQISLPA